jgi:membrane protein DedA with SNARE-associated domain
MSDPVNTGETPRSRTAQRLSDGQAFGLLAAYLVFRTVTNRVGLGVGPRLLKANAPWVIPLLNNSSLLLIQAGTGTSGQTGLLIATALTSVFMSTVTALVLYWAGWRFGHRLAELAQKPGSPWAGVWNPKQIDRAERWMDRWGIYVVFVGRVVEYFTLPVILVAGASEMRLRRFLVAHTFGAVGFAALFLWIGGAAQQRWPWLRDWISDVYGPWALRIGLVLLALVAIVFLVGRRQERKQDAPRGAPSDRPQDPTTTPSQGPSESSPPTG